jgi:glyoxylase-like metal-dependent hydrolase (beta-lactamase superfamily II)
VKGLDKSDIYVDSKSRTTRIEEKSNVPRIPRCVYSVRLLEAKTEIPVIMLRAGESMYFEQFYLGCLAHASYLLASEGEAIIVDPQRDVEIYLQAAKQHGVSIRHIFETHLHADFVSGHKELAARHTRKSPLLPERAHSAWGRLLHFPTNPLSTPTPVQKSQPAAAL